MVGFGAGEGLGILILIAEIVLAWFILYWLIKEIFFTRSRKSSGPTTK